MSDDTPNPETPAGLPAPLDADLDPITVSGLASEPAPHAGSSPRPVDPRLSDEEHPSTSSGLTVTDAQPKPYRERHDGWTVARQNQFIEVLTRTGCVLDACRMVRISSTSVYNHRQRDPDFDERWALALRRAKTPIGEVAWKRAVEGVEQEVWYHGKVVGKRTKHANDVLRLLIQRDDNGAGRDAQGRFAPAGTVPGAMGGLAAETPAETLPPTGGAGVDVDEPTEIGGQTIYPKWLALPPPKPGQPKDTLEEKLKKISDRLGDIGSRTINVRTGQGIDDEIIELVRRFVEGGRVMLPAKFKWLSPERFEKAKAEFLAKYPDGMPEDEGTELAEEYLRD